jgi:hypothetical protein
VNSFVGSALEGDLMGVNLQWETEGGGRLEELPDPHNRVSELLPDWRDESSICLRFVDLYGDTVFNRLQLPVLIAELEASVALVTDSNVAAHGRAILELAQKCQAAVHTYLRFLGD